jgi:uncharacterized protein involved in outer membrane biogenesis
MKRKILIALLVLVVIAVVAIVLVLANLGRIVRTGVQKGGTAVLGVPVTLDDAAVSVLGGYLGLDGLQIGSPAGFKAQSMFALDHAHVDVKLGSIRSDEIVVNEIVIDGADVTLEFSGRRTNWGTLMAGLESEAKEAPAPAEEKAGGKKVTIGRILFTNGKVSIAGIPLAGKASVPLPRLELTDVGKGKDEPAGPTDIRKALRDTISALYVAVVKAAGDLLPAEQLRAVADEAVGVLGEAGAAAVSNAVKAAGAAGQAARDTAAAAGGAAKGAAGAARGAAGAAGEAAAGAAEKAKGVLKGVLGGGED